MRDQLHQLKGFIELAGACVGMTDLHPSIVEEHYINSDEHLSGYIKLNDITIYPKVMAYKVTLGVRIQMIVGWGIDKYYPELGNFPVHHEQGTEDIASAAILLLAASKIEGVLKKAMYM